MKKCTGRQNALKPDQTCTLPRWGLRAALGQAEVEVEGDVHRVKNKSWETATWETAHLSSSSTMPEGHSSLDLKGIADDEVTDDSIDGGVGNREPVMKFTRKWSEKSYLA